MNNFVQFQTVVASANDCPVAKAGAASLTVPLPDDPFEHVTNLAADMFSVPLSAITLIDDQAECIQSNHCASIRCTATCSNKPCLVAHKYFADNDEDMFIVPDATADARFNQGLTATGTSGVRFYGSVRLKNAAGKTVGSLCLIDCAPRTLNSDEQQLLRKLGKVATDIVEFRDQRFYVELQRRKLDIRREKLKLTLENVRDAVLLVDRNFKLVLWNGEFLSLFNHPREMIFEGANASDLIFYSISHGDFWAENIEKIKEDPEGFFFDEANKRTEIHLSHGKIVEAWCQTTSGKFYIFTFRDVTTARQMERLKDELVSTVSHELRTPLTSISGALDLLHSGAAGTLSDRMERLVAIAQRNSTRLIQIVNDLLELDKLQHGKLLLDKQDLDLRGVIGEAIEHNQIYADQHGVSLEFAVPVEPVMVNVDRGRIDQVLANLISNACKFSPRGSTVRIKLSGDMPWALISVADEGIGISEEFRSRLFDRFSQEDGSHQKNGTGLGLPIAKGIIEAHGGTIALDPDADKGATFLVTLPLLAEN